MVSDCRRAAASSSRTPPEQRSDADAAVQRQRALQRATGRAELTASTTTVGHRAGQAHGRRGSARRLGSTAAPAPVAMDVRQAGLQAVLGARLSARDDGGRREPVAAAGDAVPALRPPRRCGPPRRLRLRSCLPGPSGFGRQCGGRLMAGIVSPDTPALARAGSIAAAPLAPMHRSVLSYLDHHPHRRGHHRIPADVDLDAQERWKALADRYPRARCHVMPGSPTCRAPSRIRLAAARRCSASSATRWRCEEPPRRAPRGLGRDGRGGRRELSQ